MGVRIYTFKWPSYFSAFFVGLLILYLGINYHSGINQQNHVYEVTSWASLNQKIVIDPGHGGVDPGAEGSGGAMEKDITLQISLKLAELLRQSGAEVVLIRDDDRDHSTSPKGYSLKKREDLKARAEMINESKADILISVHVNSFPSDKWSGAQVFYDRDSAEGKELAQAIQQSLINIMGNTTRKERPIDAYLLNKTEDITGAIVEVGFISNPEEEKLLVSVAYQERVAWAIFNGIASYMGKE